MAAPTRFAMDAAGHRGSSWRFIRLHSLVLLCVALGSALAKAADAKPPDEAPSKAAALYDTTKVWTLHLRFTPEEWAAMEPAQANFGNFFGGRPPGGPGSPSGPGSPGGPPPGGRGGFSPSALWVPALMRDGDGNGDGKLSRDEFRGIAEKWYSAWDPENKRAIKSDQLGAAINRTLPPPNAGPPRPGGGPPGGMMLQGAEGKRNGLASMMGVEFKHVHADLEFAGREFKDVAVRYKGNGTFLESRGALKRSMKIELNKYVKGQKLAGLTTLNLHSNVTDFGWMNEVLSYRLYRDAGVAAPRTAYARVFLTVPGKHDRQFVGLYSLVEDIDRDFTEENFGRKKGAILKPVTPSPFTDLGDAWANYKQTYDPKNDLTVDEANRIIEFCKFVSQADDATFSAKIGEFLELDSVAHYFAVTVWLSTVDSILGPGQNYYVYLHPKTNRFHLMPWDLDHSFGQFPLIGSQEQREQLSIAQPWRGGIRFLERLFKVEAFQKPYRAKLEELTAKLGQPQRIAQQVDEIAAAIRPSVKEESEEKLERFDKVVAGEPAARVGMPMFGAPPKPIKGFVKARFASVRAQLDGTSEGLSLNTPPPGGFNVGNLIASAFTTAFDANKDATLTRDEFVGGFAGWFEKWNTDRSGILTDEQLRAGIDTDLAPARPRPPANP